MIRSEINGFERGIVILSYHTQNSAKMRTFLRNFAPENPAAIQWVKYLISMWVYRDRTDLLYKINQNNPHYHYSSHWQNHKNPIVHMYKKTTFFFADVLKKVCKQASIHLIDRHLNHRIHFPLYPKNGFLLTKNTKKTVHTYIYIYIYMCVCAKKQN